MPLGKTDSQLAEEFVTFFLEKIDRIRDRFKGIAPYQPRQLGTSQLEKFALISSRQLEKNNTQDETKDMCTRPHSH